MEAGQTETYEQKMEALDELMGMITDRRMLVEFTICEKIEKTYRIQSSSWTDAKQKISRSSDEGCYDSFAIEEELEGDHYFHIDGSHCYVKSYAPQYEKKVREVKIGYRWFELEDLKNDPIYYLEKVRRWV
jgi:hypothetical protein